jgi:hypothetical protein
MQSSLLQYPKSAYSSLLASLRLVGARKRMIRSYSVRSIITALAGFFGLVYLGALNTGYFAYITAISPEIEFNDLALLVFERMYNNDFIFLGSVSVIAFFSYIFFAPIIGTATLSLVSEDEGLSLGLPRGHKFFDALILNLLSGVGILQLLIGTGIATIMSLEGNKIAGALSFAIFWLGAGVISTVIGWLRELSVQKIGFPKTLLAGLIIVSGLGFIVTSILLPTLSNLYGRYILFISSIETTLLAIILLFALLLVAMFSIFGHRVSEIILNNYFSKSPTVQKEKQSSIKTNYPRLLNNLILTSLVVFRTKEVKRTIVIVGLIGVLSMAFAPLDGNVISGIVIGFIATLNLSWLANYLGLLGSGNILLASMPKIYNKIPVTTTIFSGLISLAYSLSVLTFGLVAGRISVDSYFHMMLLAGLLSTILPSLAVTLAIKKPYRTRLEGRGDVLIPPTISLLYLALFISISIVINAVVSSSVVGFASFLLFGLLIVAIAFFTNKAIERYWLLDETQYRIIKMANGD